jgi:hypothetical protein
MHFNAETQRARRGAEEKAGQGGGEWIIGFID